MHQSPAATSRRWPVLLLNADRQSISFFPNCLIHWQEAIKAFYLERVDIVATYNDVVRSPSSILRVPSVVALTEPTNFAAQPNFNSFNLRLRDGFTCQYCGTVASKRSRILTEDHVFPKSRGGDLSWLNAVTACQPCNGKKADRTPEEADMPLLQAPFVPTNEHMTISAIRSGIMPLHPTWHRFLSGFEKADT